jgi:N-acetylglucosaminyl-diphospho-decaprenol L-rhamnosyltransferase
VCGGVGCLLHHPLMKNSITLSVVSHGQMALAVLLLRDLAKHCAGQHLKVVLTLNLPEDIPCSSHPFPFELLVLRNDTPRGFSHNHNAAFSHAGGDYFCVINPDVRIDGDVFPSLMTAVSEIRAGVVSPLIIDENGVVESSARKFPTPLKIFKKVLSGIKEKDYEIGNLPIDVDWVGGMFMVFRRDFFEMLGGFDRKYFLYYEDVDLCARVRLKGFSVVLIPFVAATHVARRSSHRDSKYFFFHVRSMLRFFTSIVFLKVMLIRAK